MPDETGSVSFEFIGRIESPFDEKFLIPRQPGLVPIRAKLIFYPPFNEAIAFDGLESVSHLWLQFVFDGHKAAKTSNELRVRPPRFGGNKKVGVFATRSSFRPNPLGLSLVKLLSVERKGNTAVLWLEGVDCLNGTQVIDIKPYLPYTDIDLEAMNVFANEAPVEDALIVSWSSEAIADLEQLQATGYFLRQDLFDCMTAYKSALQALIELDPRPSYHASQSGLSREYGVSFSGLNITFRCQDKQACVTACHDESFVSKV